MAEWQTRRTQNPLPARACGFKSRSGHAQVKSSTKTNSTNVYKTREAVACTASSTLERKMAVERHTTPDSGPTIVTGRCHEHRYHRGVRALEAREES